jgi:predicted lactoylglutathione lyase
MQQQISVITLGVSDLHHSKRFYSEGFGWTPIFDNGEIAFYQMNGLVLGTWLKHELEADAQRANSHGSGAITLAHNVDSGDSVDRLVERLVRSGGRLLRAPDAPPHGGFRGYVADPDDHAWEIAWNPAWHIDERGHVTFGL